MSTWLRDCSYHLRFCGADYCKLPAIRSPSADFKRLDLGCDCRKVDYQPVEWKRNLWPEPPDNRPAAQILEWEDES
jgi:hypothetical protein